MKVAVIGGDAAGMSAASKIRRMDADAVINVYEQSGVVSYGACGLPYYIAGYNGDEKKLIARSVEDYRKMNINVRLNCSVISVDFNEKSLTFEDKSGGTTREFYDKLMIASGASPIVPNISGITKRGVYFLKNIEDAVAIKEAASGYGVANAVVIGGGYIGIELCEALRAQKKEVTLIEAKDRILDGFEPEIAEIAKAELISNGVTVKTGEQVAEILGGASAKAVVTDKGSYSADIVLAAVGVKPNTEFLANSGIRTEANGAIYVDRYQKTNIEDVYSAGDCASVFSLLKNKNVYMPLGTHANKCGRLAGANICGAHEQFLGILGSAALKVFGKEIAKTGLTQSEADAMGANAASVVTTAFNRPNYYPNQQEITIKLVYGKETNRILGAQLAGGAGTALRADVFAAAIETGLTAKALGMSDLIYSPPFATVWDAVQIACNAAK